MTDPLPTFPAGFTWGVATAAYQIEGAAAQDGRGPSIWDTFAHEPGRIGDGSTGDIACDHYHRYAEDVALMADLGIGGYRFSVSWSRVQPAGKGPANAPGLAFYDRLTDALLERGIAPLVTLFHWDLPQAVQDHGGWFARDTAARFGEYADLVAGALGDRVALWMTLNEPFVHTSLGHVVGTHAPGLTNLDNPFPVVHHQLLGHGLAAAALRRHSRAPVSLANNYTPVWPVGADGTRASATEADGVAAALYDVFHNRLFTDPLLLGEYPPAAAALSTVDLSEVVRDGDLALICAPLDALGVNYYSPTGVSAPPEGGPLPFNLIPLAGYPTTGFGWPIVPDGLRETLVTLAERYAGALPPVWITENGAAVPEPSTVDSILHDRDRIAYLDGHLRAVHAAMAAGVEVRGYLVWSLLDNFEWAEGYTQRFGLVHVDFDSGRRTPKASYLWYRDVASRA
jgi:beta-glucosidase